MIPLIELPIPNATAVKHSQKLTQHIRQVIDYHNGYISFARFMELALYAPGLGYYSAGMYKFGNRGDFMTAPDISPLFAKCVAQQCKDILMELGNGNILELGAGSGIFAKDLLLELETLGCLPQHYFILEISAELRERQQQLLKKECPHLLSQISWLDTLPEHISGIIFANEVLDALPTHCFRIEEREIKEKCVAWQQNTFAWHITSPTTPNLTTHVTTLLEECALANHYESEANLLLAGWIHSLAHILKKGIILLLDYGYGRTEYYHPDRYMGTLMCYYQHRQHADPFKLVGLQDMTAHVDFTAVIESAVAVNLSLIGYTTQAGFLLGCGLLEFAVPTNDLATYQQNQAIKMLTLPSQMGELVKVIALGKDFNAPLKGFSLYDRRRDL